MHKSKYRVKLPPNLSKQYIYMLGELVLKCTNVVGSNPAEGGTTLSLTISVIGGGNRRIRMKSLTCYKSLINYQLMLYRVYLVTCGNQTHNISGNKHRVGGCKLNDHTDRGYDGIFF